MPRAAFFGFAPAQYTLSHAYEYAGPPFLFDPLWSVQYHRWVVAFSRLFLSQTRTNAPASSRSLASQQGEPEMDTALSKWFLCSAEGAFEEDEKLAITFEDKVRVGSVILHGGDHDYVRGWSCAWCDHVWRVGALGSIVCLELT